MTTEQTLSAKLDARPATFTCDKSKVGPLYYFAVADRAPGPYKTQRHVEAIIDIADDGTLAGVELIDSMPPPPLAQQALRTTETAQWFAVQSVSGTHVGMWQDRRIAERVFREEYPDGKFIPLYAQPPAEGVRATDAMVERITGHLFNRLGLSRWGIRLEDVEKIAREILTAALSSKGA